MGVVLLLGGNVAGAAGTLPVDWAGWGQAALLAGAILAAAAMLRGRRKEAHDPAPPKAFAKFITGGVDRQTEQLRDGFVAKLREAPDDFPSAQEYLRRLRQLLRNATGFIERVDKRAFEEWPELALYNAFHDWADPIRHTDQLLQDMLDDLQAASHKALVGPLLEQYRRSEWAIRMDLEGLEARRKAVAVAARPILRHGKEKAHGHDHDDAAEHSHGH